MNAREDKLLYTDELTGVYNRRYLGKIEDVFFETPEMDGDSISIAVADIDHFKEINDIYGHLKGDKAIKFFASFLRENLRDRDIIIRYGGDEFVIVQRGLKKQDAFVAWQRIIEKLKSSKFDGLQLSISVGIASYPDDGKVFKYLFEQADKSLYKAKRSGRGRVGIEGEKRIKIPPVKFVNRTNEIDALLKSMDRGIIAVVKGEAGSGKTRLIKEVLSTMRGKDIMWSDCLALEWKISYYPVRELLKYRLKRGGSELIKDISMPYIMELAKIVPEVLDTLNINKDTSGDDILDRYRLFEGFKQLLNAGSKSRIIVIDNVQWIDEESLEALKYVIRNRNKDTVFIFASRIEEVADHCEKFFRDLSREQSIEEILLESMPEEHMQEVVRVIMGESVPYLERYIAKSSTGNVFYAEEIIKSLSDGDYLIFERGAWKFKEPEYEISPKGVEDVIKRKFSRLSEQSKELAVVLSVARKGYIELLIELSGFNEGEVFGLLDECLGAVLIKERDDYVEYKNELIRQIIYQTEVSSLKKRRLHLKVANWLEKHFPAGNEEELAYHFKMARVPEKIVKYGVLAGDKSMKLYTNNEALKYFGWARQVLTEFKDDRDKSEQLTDILQKISTLKQYLGMFDESLRDIEEAIEISTAHGFKNLKAESMNTKAGTLWYMGKIQDAFDVLHEAIKFCEENNVRDELAYVYSNIGVLYSNVGDYDKAIEYYEKSISMTEEEAKKPGTLNNIGLVYNYLGDYPKALEYFKMSHELFQKHGPKRGVIVATANIGLVYTNMNKYDGALKFYRKALKMAEEIGFMSTRAYLLDSIGIIYRDKGKFDMAERLFKDAIKLSESIGDKKLLGYSYHELGLLYDARGEFNNALEYYRKSFEIAKENGEKRSIVIRRSNMGTMLVLMGEFEKGEKALLEASALAEKMKVSYLKAFLIRALLNSYVEMMSWEKAEGMLVELEEMRENEQLKNYITDDAMMIVAKYYLERGILHMAQKYLQECEDKIANTDIPSVKLELSLLKFQYHFLREDFAESEKLLDEVYNILKIYRNKSKLAVYLFFKAQLACIKGVDRAHAILEDSRKLFKQLKLEHRFERLIEKYKWCNS